MQLEASNREVNNSVPSKYSTEICVFSRQNYLKFIGFEVVDWIMVAAYLQQDLENSRSELV